MSKEPPGVSRRVSRSRLPLQGNAIPRQRHPRLPTPSAGRCLSVSPARSANPPAHAGRLVVRFRRCRPWTVPLTSVARRKTMISHANVVSSRTAMTLSLSFAFAILVHRQHAVLELPGPRLDVQPDLRLPPPGHIRPVQKQSARPLYNNPVVPSLAENIFNHGVARSTTEKETSASSLFRCFVVKEPTYPPVIHRTLRLSVQNTLRIINDFLPTTKNLFSPFLLKSLLNPSCSVFPARKTQQLP